MSEELAGMDGLKLLGGRLCLDFANTVDPRHGDHQREYLADYSDLLRWGRRAGALGEGEERRLLEEASLSPRKAAAAFGRALALREAVYRVFSALAHEGEPEAADLETLGVAYLDAMKHSRFVHKDQGFEWAPIDEDDALDRPLWSVARSAADLLVSGDLGRIKECPGSDDCGWLFYDSSKNASRRWCSMEGCGSRVKMRRMYARTRAAGASAKREDRG